MIFNSILFFQKHNKMNYPCMPVIIQVPNQSLTIPFDDNTFTFKKGLTLNYFGQAEPIVTSMIDEINGHTKIYFSKFKLLFCLEFKAEIKKRI